MTPNDPVTRAMTQSGSRLQRGRASLAALWVTQVALAVLFLMAGGSKLAGVPAMVSMFDAIGVGQWFRYVTGVIEVTSGDRAAGPRCRHFRGVAAHSHDARCDRHKPVRCPRLSGDATSALARSGRRRVGPSPPASNALTNTSACSERTVI